MQREAAVEWLDLRLWVDHLDFVEAMQKPSAEGLFGMQSLGLMGELAHQSSPRDGDGATLDAMQSVSQPGVDVQGKRRALERGEGSAI